LADLLDPRDPLGPTADEDLVAGPPHEAVVRADHVAGGGVEDALEDPRVVDDVGVEEDERPPLAEEEVARLVEAPGVPRGLEVGRLDVADRELPAPLADVAAEDLAPVSDDRRDPLEPERLERVEAPVDDPAPEDREERLRDLAREVREAPR